MRTGWCRRIYGAGTAKEQCRKRQGTISTSPSRLAPRRAAEFNSHASKGTKRLLYYEPGQMLSQWDPFESCKAFLAEIPLGTISLIKTERQAYTCEGNGMIECVPRWSCLKPHTITVAKTRKTHQIS
ncbi:hypothetical protein BDW67DRAFT_136621 [Aspergillus spinulosporus]